MWIMHADEVHFDLLIRTDGELAKEGTVDDMEINMQEDEKVEEEELLEKEGTVDAMEIDNKQEDEKVVEEEELENAPLGPGYMGWKLNDEEKDSPPHMDFKDKIAEFKDGYDEMKRKFGKTQG